MFGTIRRHQSWLWYIIVAFMIVSFVVYFNPSTRSGGGLRPGAEGNYGKMDGQAVTTEQFENARREFSLLLSLQNRRQDLDAAQMKYEIYREMFMAAKQEQMGIHPSAQAAAQFARDRILGNNMSYDDFVDKRLKPIGLTSDDFDRFLRHQVGNEQLRVLAGLAGTFVTPGEAETLYRSEHRALVTELAWFPTSNFLNAVTIIPADVSEFYAKEAANYRIPDQVVVNFIRFDATNYLAATGAYLTNLASDVQRYYDQMGTNTFPDAKTPDEIKAKIRSEAILQRELLDAEHDAADFAVELEKRGNHPGDLEALAKERGLTIHTTAPFDEDNGPKDSKVPADFAKDAFQLTDDEPYRWDLVGEDGVYIIGLKQKLPSRKPDFKDIESKVTADYRELQAYQLAAQAATNFSTALTNEMNVNNGVTLPKTFADICAENGVKVQTLPPFSLSTTNLPPEVADLVDLQSLKRAGFSADVGTASRPGNVRDGSFVLYVEKMLPVDESQLKAEMPAFLAYMRDVRRNDAFTLWVNYQIRQDPDLVTTFTQLVKDIQSSAPAAGQSGQ